MGRIGPIRCKSTEKNRKSTPLHRIFALVGAKPKPKFKHIRLDSTIHQHVIRQKPDAYLGWEGKALSLNHLRTALQKAAFRSVKHGLRACKKRPFTRQKATNEKAMEYFNETSHGFYHFDWLSSTKKMNFIYNTKNSTKNTLTNIIIFI